MRHLKKFEKPMVVNGTCIRFTNFLYMSYLIINISIFVKEKFLKIRETIEDQSKDRGGVGAEGARAPRNLVDQQTLFKPEGPDYTSHTTASPPGFKKLSTSLLMGCYCSPKPLQSSKQDIRARAEFKK